jgi:hypothetical protein
LVMGAYPVAPSILYRTCGIVVGAAAIRWLVQQDAGQMRQRLGRLVPLVVVPYLACVLLVNRLISVHWQSFDQALGAYPLGFLPLFDYYIVTKGEAAKNIIGHAALYMPIGIMLWLRYANASPGQAFILAALLSFLVEVGRYFRPGLEGDINAVAVAGVSAMLAFRAMPSIWTMVEALGRQARATSVRRWDTRDQKIRPIGPQGEVEHF